MSMRGGQILTYGGQYLVSRLNSAGAGEPNRQEERTYELGNYESTGRTKDIPQVPWSMESLDATTDFEALLTGLDPSSVTDQQIILLTDAKPLDIISPVKSPYQGFEANQGYIVPQLLLNSAVYRFGVRANATESFEFVGDSLYFVTEGVPRQMTVLGSAGAGPHTFTDGPAIVTSEQGDDVYAYSVCLQHSDGSYDRLFIGEGYTNTASGFTLTEAPAASDIIHVTYAVAGPDNHPQSIHPSSSLKPNALRAKDIDFYVSDGAATPTYLRWRGVQSVEFNWRVNREPDEELGNAHYVSNDYDIPELTGSVTMRAQNVEYLMARIAQILGTPVGETANVLADVPLEAYAVLRHPTTGVALKTLYTPDARFNPPGTQAQANAKVEQTFNFSSDTGGFRVVRGEYTP